MSLGHRPRTDRASYGSGSSRSARSTSRQRSSRSSSSPSHPTIALVPDERSSATHPGAVGVPRPDHDACVRVYLTGGQPLAESAEIRNMPCAFDHRQGRQVEEQHTRQDDQLQGNQAATQAATRKPARGRRTISQQPRVDEQERGHEQRRLRFARLSEHDHEDAGEKRYGCRSAEEDEASSGGREAEASPRRRRPGARPRGEGCRWEAGIEARAPGRERQRLRRPVTMFVLHCFVQ